MTLLKIIVALVELDIADILDIFIEMAETATGIYILEAESIVILLILKSLTQQKK